MLFIYTDFVRFIVRNVNEALDKLTLSGEKSVWRMCEEMKWRGGADDDEMFRGVINRAVPS